MLIHHNNLMDNNIYYKPWDLIVILETYYNHMFLYLPNTGPRPASSIPTIKDLS
jgi:hypothetical protein